MRDDLDKCFVDDPGAPPAAEDEIACPRHTRLAETLDGRRIQSIIEGIGDPGLLVQLPFATNPVTIEGVRGFWSFLADAPIVVRERRYARDAFEIAALHHDACAPLLRFVRERYAGGVEQVSARDFAASLPASARRGLGHLWTVWCKVAEVERARAASGGPLSISELARVCALLPTAEERADDEETARMMRALVALSVRFEGT